MSDRPDLIHVCEGHKKWDALVLTAEKHVEAFQLQIKNEPGILELVDRVFVVKDEPEDVKIGSGGATLRCLEKLYDEFNENLYGLRIILIHSGGYSQRLPHVSALGKVFLLMPNGMTFLEMKIRSYERVLRNMSPGVLVCASDTFEWFSPVDLEKSGDFTLFAHESTLKIAQQHGVFIIDKQSNLKSVLQKPSEEKMRNAKAIRADGLSLTDGCYIMHKNVIERLLRLYKKHGSVSCEICCYGDFMRPLGTEPILDYLNVDDRELAFWRTELKDALKDLNARVINLGPDSFFHLGTLDEMLSHFDQNSIFAKKFLSKYQCSIVLYSNVAHPELINPKTWVQYCSINDKVHVGSNTVLSDIEIDKNAEIDTLPENAIILTICIKLSEENGYVTVIFHKDDCLKQNNKIIQWFGHSLNFNEETSLWSARIFKIEKSAQLSLKTTLDEIKSGPNINEKRISIEDAVLIVDIEQVVRRRQQLRS